jgi:hypothetical protein
MKELNNRTKMIRKFLVEMPSFEKKFFIGTLVSTIEVVYHSVSIKDLLIQHQCIRVEQQNLLTELV